MIFLDCRYVWLCDNKTVRPFKGDIQDYKKHLLASIGKYQFIVYKYFFLYGSFTIVDKPNNRILLLRLNYCEELVLSLFSFLELYNLSTL